MDQITVISGTPNGRGEQSESVDGDERLEFTKFLVADSANHHQVLYSAKSAKTSPVVNDARSHRASDSWQDFQLTRGRSVDVYA